MHQWLRAEFGAARERVRPHHRAWFQEAGVHPSSLAAVGGFGVARIAVEGGRFDIAAKGEAAVILPVFDLPVDPELTGLYDLVAFRPSDPRTLYRRRSEAAWLGGFALARALDLDEPVALFRTPISWLRAGGDGVVPLDWQAATRQLLDLTAITPEDDIFAHEIETRLKEALLARLPRVRAAAGSALAAA